MAYVREFLNRIAVRLGPHRADVLVLAVAGFSLVVSCSIVSNAKYFWHDELYSWYFLADPSFGSMWTAFHDELNVTPPLYFLLGWGWAQVMGASELSLRLFSSLGIGAAMVLTWATLRKAYGFWPTFMGTFTVFLTSEIVLAQNAEARMYGLFLALCAAGVLQYMSLGARGRYWLRDLVWVAVVHAAIVNTHLFGFFYSAAILSAFFIRDRSRGRLRPQAYLAIGVGWLSFLIYLPAFLAQSGVVRPRGWLPAPLLSDLFGLVSLVSPAFVDVRFVSALLLALILIYLMHATNRDHSGRDDPAIGRARRSLIIIAFALLAPVAATWIFSRTIRPIFWDRYLLPSILAYCIGIAHLTSRVLSARIARAPEHRPGKSRESGGRPLIARVVLALLGLVLLVNPLVSAARSQEQTLEGQYDRQFGHADLPAVVKSPGGFLQRWHYAADPERYFFVLDEEAANQPESGLFGLQTYKHMKAFRRNYPRIGSNILDSDEFLERFDRFRVIDYVDYDRACPSQLIGLQHARDWTEIHCPRWLEERLLRSPDYEVTPLGVTDNWRAVLLVEHRSTS
jgi:fumarate reductase subunit D